MALRKRLDWDHRDDDRRRGALDDFSRLQQLRKTLRPDIRAAEVGVAKRDFFVMTAREPTSLPAPNWYSSSDGVVVIAGNPFSTPHDLSIDCDNLPLPLGGVIELADLWTDDPPRRLSRGERVDLRISGDGHDRGGVGVWLPRVSDAS